MHDLDTLRRLHDEAAERELAREYGRAVIVSDSGRLGPERRNAIHERIRLVRARLLALGAALLALGCSSAVEPRSPDIAGPCPPPGAMVVRPVAAHTLRDGSIVLIMAKRPAR